MTMQATIVNTSNWDGEDILVDGKRLKPGESTSLGLEHMDGAEKRVPIVSRPAEQTEPFYFKGLGSEQVWPKVTVTVGLVEEG